MQLLNYSYESADSLKKFIVENKIISANSVLIQLFYSLTCSEEIYPIKEALLELLPNASLLGTSTAGMISDGKILDGGITISFSLFNHSHVKSNSFYGLSIDEIVPRLSDSLITDKTKLLVCFANTFRFDSELLLQKITQIYPDIVIVGGNGGDDLRFEKCDVFSTTCNNCDVAFAAIDSDLLKIETKYLFNWHPIGKELRITKSVGKRVYEIDNQKTVDIYEHYLGKEILENILRYGIEFPLIQQEKGIEIGRTPLIDHGDGSLTFSGELKEGSIVKFGYANVEYIEDYNRRMLLDPLLCKSEAIYIYSCSARRSMLGTYLDEEVAIINEVAATSGFIAYGEFFHDSNSHTNHLLNISTTYVSLSEEDGAKKKIGTVAYPINIENKDMRLKALTTLISRTSEELDEKIHYLKQFENIVNEVAIFSISDEKGIITGVNKNFEIISGYTEEELIGKSHSIIRHEDVPKEMFAEMWATIKSGKIWKGRLKNKTKNGIPYYVVSDIGAIYNRDGSFKEYIAIRTDVTQLEEYKEILKNELDSTNRSFEENINYMKQYEEAINSTTAIIKTDTNNIINYVNEKFCELSGYSLAEVIGRNCEELRHQKHLKLKTCDGIRKELSEKKVVQKILTNIRKDGEEYTVNNLFYPIVDIDGNLIEYLQIMHDLTEIVTLNEEIVTTQKEVLFTMGAIGETRSKETGLHVKRVAEYSYLLAKLSNMSEEDASLLKQASPMHDIGKVGIADNILNKPGKLTFDEFEVMKTHAQLGYEMLKNSQRPILKASAIVALTHHEKYDGTGYPRGLVGEDIPIYGRITAIADVFDALGNDRVYKKAWPLEDILILFREGYGKHFDPKLIRLFFDNLDQFLEIRDSMREDLLS
ncbi:MAG: PAS domain S-box protein [Campylobacterales bacterium]|nr:PAS domain S-box protein [Campylobacterales bacterium]